VPRPRKICNVRITSVLYSHVHPRPHWLWTWLGGAALLGAAVVWLVVLARAVSLAPSAWATPFAGVAAALVGWLLADLISGVVHLSADELGDERTPLVGRNVIAPFREHHRDPRAMTEHGVVETNGDSALAVLPVMLGGLWLGSTMPGLEAFAQHVGLLSFSAAILLTNQIHQWAHTRHAPCIVRWLQRHAVILSPVHHAQHHRFHDRAFCITSGWCNPLLDKLLSPRRKPSSAGRHPRSSP
jgi:plasmanylethanolamine desaturase